MRKRLFHHKVKAENEEQGNSEAEDDASNSALELGGNDASICGSAMMSLEPVFCLLSPGFCPCSFLHSYN